MTTPLEAIRAEAHQRAGGRHDDRLQWFRDAKFGLFIHWGLYAVPAGTWNGAPVDGIGEWIMKRARIPVAEYEQLAERFDPVGFNAAEWVALAKEAGQRYLTITAKHHDGFCMFDSAVTDYNIVHATPFGRDPMAELAEECGRQGLKLCFYYSQTQDWHHPDGDGNDWDYDESKKNFGRYIEDYVKPQLRELLTKYGPIGLIWFDTPKGITRDQSHGLVQLVHELQPDCLVNGRIGNALGDYAEARDNAIPAEPVDMDWETPVTMNNTWGFRTNDENWKSPDQLVRQLIDITSKGGNYLLNVGPTAQGEIPVASADRLRAVGRWLHHNGESIYATRPGPIQNMPWCRSTARQGRIYIQVLDWPAGGTLHLPDSGADVSAASLLADGTPLHLHRSGSEIIIEGPADARDQEATVIVLDQ